MHLVPAQTLALNKEINHNILMEVQQQPLKYSSLNSCGSAFQKISQAENTW